MPDIVKIGRRGQPMLPARVRAALDLRDGDELVVSLEQEAIVLRPKACRFAQYLESLGRPPTDRDRP